MRALITVFLGLVLSLGALAASGTPAYASVVAGSGYSSAYAGESAFTSVGPGETGQSSAIFFNDGTRSWLPGVVGLLVCAPDKVSCGVPWNSSFARGWYSPSVYATVNQLVAPGQTAFFVYSFTVPTTTPGGTVTTFYGDVGLIPTGALLRPEGYYHVNTAPYVVPNLTLSPSVLSLAQGAYQQFSVGGLPFGVMPTWTVNGGCGAITAGGLFAATAMNSPSQPCSVIASALGWTGIATISVYGAASQLACEASPSRLVADGGSTTAGTAIATVTLKDVNGNTVRNAYAPVVNLVNITPSLATMSPTGAVAPAAGVVAVTIQSTLSPGPIQLSVSAPGLVGCNVIITSAGAGTASRTVPTLSTNTLAADGVSTTTLQVDVTDSSGFRVTSDNFTQLQVNQVAGGAACTVVAVSWGVNLGLWNGGAVATAVQGRVAILIRSTTTPGTCLFSIATNNTSIAGGGITLTTRYGAGASRLGVIATDPANIASGFGWCDPSGSTDPGCATIVIGVQDPTGALQTGDFGRVVTATLDPATCSGAGGGNVIARGATTTSGGRATFAFSSAGAYGGCTITFSSTNLGSVSTTVSWSARAADHLACTFFPASVPVNSTALSQATVSVRDSLGNVVTDGTYPIVLMRQSGALTTLTTTNPQYSNGGYAAFTVAKAFGSSGVDTYAVYLSGGALASPSLPCTISAP